MQAVGRALLWQQWTRGRAATAAVLLYVTALAAAAHAPAGMAARVAIFSCASPLALAALFLLAGYAFPEADLLARRSGFPSWMLTLPVPTRSLIFWPMLGGAVAAALCWIVPAALVLRPLGLAVPLGWPAALLAAMLAFLQTLLWTPFGLPYARVGTALVLIPTLVTLVVNAAVNGTSPTSLSLVCLSMLLGAYGAAVAGVARARCGEMPVWEWRASRRTRNIGRLAFTSPRCAQHWFECRTGGTVLPFAVGIVGVLVSLPLIWVRELTPLTAPAGSPLAAIQVNLWLKLQQGSLFFPPLLAAILGCGRRGYDARRKEFTIHPFLATRPLPSRDFVIARCLAALRSTLAAWGVLLLFVTLWLILPARQDGKTAPLLLVLWRESTWQTAVTHALLLAILVLWTWKSQVQGLFADLSGRAWLVYGAPLLAHSALLAAWCAYLQGSIALQGPHAGPGGIPRWLLGLLTGAVALKAVVAAGTWIAVRRRSLASTHQLLTLLGAWTLVALALFGACCWIAVVGAPSSPLAEFTTRTYLPFCSSVAAVGWRSPGVLASLVVLFLPFGRLLAAVLMLDGNRHR